jgi:nucleoside-diphosphate-sugar epimerase
MTAHCIMYIESDRLILVVGDKGNLANTLSSLNNGAIPLVKTNKISEINRTMEFSGSIDVIYTSFCKTKEPMDYMQLNKYTKQTVGMLSEVISIILKNKEKVRSFIYCSSAAVYGNKLKTIESEAAYPVSLYGHIKHICERLAIDSLTNNIQQVVAARIFNMFGGSDKFSIVHRIEKAARNSGKLYIANDGNTVRDFIHVEDVAQILLHLRGIEPLSGVINIGTGTGVSIGALIRRAEEKYERKLRIDYYKSKEVKHSIANIEKLALYWDTNRLISVLNS